MNAVTRAFSPAETALGEQFRLLRDALGADGSVRARDAAFAEFAAAGLPSRRVESWHYTDLRGMLREPFAPARVAEAQASDAARHVLDALADMGPRIVVLDGRYAPELSNLASLGPHVSVRRVAESLGEDGARGADKALAAAQALGQGEAVFSLNAAFLQGGVVIDIEPGTKVELPIELVYVASGSRPSAVYARSCVKLGTHASANLIERHLAAGEAPSQGNHVLVLALEDGAALDHVTVLDNLGSKTMHIGTTLARLGADVRLTALTLTATQGITRRQAFVEFIGAASSAHFRGVSLLGGQSHADTTLVLTHSAPGCESRELYKHILDDDATGVFQGKVIVSPGAQKTDGKMLSKAIFLSDGAAMFNKPELEIFADDVVCGHGATVGALDEDQLFYLRARGIALQEAQAMLLEAFAAEAIEGIGTEAVGAELTERVSRWLRQHAR